MPRGTGVATYGYTLAHVLAGAGWRVEGVFGIDAGRDPALAETLFFDRFARGETRGRLALAPAYRPWLRLHAREVPLTDRIDRRVVADRWPPFTRLVTAPRLFALAHRHFATFGRFLPLAMADPPPIMHWTYPVPIRLTGARNIYTLHDLVPLTVPGATLTHKANYHALIRGCIARAAAIATVSEASRQEAIGLFGIAPDRIVDCGQTILPLHGRPADRGGDAAAIAAAFGLEADGYFLYFGAIEPKKNVGRLIEAHLAADVATPLVIVGGKGWQGESETALLRPDPSLGAALAAALGQRVRVIDHLPRTLLARLVRQARAVTFPSIAEGFGLPILEAMAAGTPVLTARGGATEEVAGGAALLIDPLDVDDIAAGLRALDHDGALRARLAAAGPAQAGRFSPARYRARLEKLYQQAMATAKP